MDRRRFIAQICVLPAAGYVATRAARARAQSEELHDLQSFGYYDALLDDQQRDPRSTDGTDYDMPCITAEDIEAGAEKQYDFWHGHGGRKHRFVVTADDFAALKNGETVYCYTDMLGGHRHALRIAPSEHCNRSC